MDDEVIEFERRLGGSCLWGAGMVGKEAKDGNRGYAGIVTLTHHKLRQLQDIGSKATSEYSIWWLGPSATS